MQVSVEATQGLERRLTVSVPVQRIDNEVAKRLQKLTRTAKIDGFRVGKIPMQIIKSRFNAAVYDEVIRDEMGNTLQEALTQEKLYPVGMPEITPLALQPGSDLQYTATFEIYPEIHAVDLQGVTIEKQTTVLDEQDIDNVIDKLKKQAKRWQPVERAAQQGDLVEVSFTGMVDGEVLKEGSAEHFHIVIGAQRLIPGFEEGLIGATLDSEVNLDLKFPEDYPASELAGKPVQFKVKVLGISEGQEPEIDDEFASSLGIKEGGVAAMRAQIRETLQQGAEQIIASRLKEQVLEQWLQRNPVELPKRLIQQEIARLTKQANKNKQSAHDDHVHGPDCDHDHEHHHAHDDAAIDESLLKNAERNIALGLLFHDAVEKYKLTVDPELVRKEVERMAGSYQDPREVIAWYYSDKNRLAEVETLVLENQLVEKLLEGAQVVENSISYPALIGTEEGE